MSNEYLGLYLEEARELWDDGVAAISAGGDPGRDQFLRAAHTVKGMSGTMGYKSLSAAIHHLEDLARDNFANPDISAVWQAIGAALDRAAATQNAASLEEFQWAPLESAQPAPDNSVAPDNDEPVSKTAPGDTGAWYRLTPTESEPMPAVRIKQWRLELVRMGFGQIHPADDQGELATDLQVFVEDPVDLNRISSLRNIGTIAMVESFADEAGAAVESSPAGPVPRTPGLVPAPVLRVDLRRIDTLFDEIGQLQTHLRVLNSVEYGSRSWGREMREVQSLATRAVHRAGVLRLSTLAPLMDSFEQSAMQAAESQGKNVRFVRDGESIRVAREIVERLRPLIPHMARNAVVHGIEGTNDRIAAGKDPTGEIRFSAVQEGVEVRLTIADDGGGVDVGRLREKAATLQIDVPDDAAEDELLRLLFVSGFSTREEADDLAGRGVGLDAIKEAVESAGGRVRAEQHRGQFFRIELTLPVPLTIQNVVEVESGKASFGLVDTGWQPVEKVNGSAPAVLPGSSEAGGTVLSDGVFHVKVGGWRRIPDVLLHRLRPPLDRIRGASGFYLDEDGRPKILYRPMPEGSA